MKEKELKDILRKDFNFEKKWKPLFSLLFNKVQYFSNPSNPFSENEKVKSGKQIGVVKLDDGKSLAIFEVEIDDSLRIDRNRQGLREIAIKHIDQNITHGAFVFFYSKNQTDYRFSFIAKWSEIDLESGEFKKGETKPKRYTYLLGGNEACTTAAKRLLLLATKRENLIINDILEVFSVESLTKEFYNELSNWYFWALQNVKFPDDFEPDEEVRNATSIIRLITRLIFVWFLKQKGLIPDGLFDEKELKQILNYSDKSGSTYYNNKTLRNITELLKDVNLLKNSGADVVSTITKIDELIFNLYELTEYEKEIIKEFYQINVDRSEEKLQTVQSKDIIEYFKAFKDTFSLVLSPEHTINASFNISQNLGAIIKITIEEKSTERELAENNTLQILQFVKNKQLTETDKLLQEEKIKIYEPHHFYLIKSNQFKDWTKRQAYKDAREEIELLLSNLPDSNE